MCSCACSKRLTRISECLRDLRRLWRQDDTDASRAIARVLADLGTLHNDLIPILLHCAGADASEKEQKIALACTDLMTALTWPIDWSAELHDIATREEDEHVLSKLLELQGAQIQYKASILRVRAKEPRLSDRNVLSCVLRHVLVPSLKPRTERTDRDIGVVSMCLHFFRNLLTIRDPPLHTTKSSANIANTALHSVLVQQMESAHILATLRMLASQADSKDYDLWTPVVADCVYQMYAGTIPSQLSNAGGANAQASNHAGARGPAHLLAHSLASEARTKRASLRGASARHSRFGTSIQFHAHDGTLRMAHSPAALTDSVAHLEQRVMDRTKRRVSRQRPATERGAPPRRVLWTPGAAAVLCRWADQFVQDGLLDVLVRAYLRDIHAERERVGDLDMARCKAMYIASFFIDYALARHMQLELVSAWLEPWSFRLVRARTAVALENRQWLEFTVSLRLWTVLLKLVDALSRGSPAEQEAADSLQHTLYYDGDLLDTALHAMHAYSAQSFACLEAVVDFAYMMPRLLERHAAKSAYMFVKQRRRRQPGQHDTDDQTDVPPDADTNVRSERVFRFESFERAMASASLVHACTQYLARYRDSEHAHVMLPKLASVVYRIIVRVSRVALFFSAKVRRVWAHAMHDSFALRQAHERAASDLTRLYHIIHKSFTRLSEASRAAYNADRRPPKPALEMFVRSDLSHSEQIGVAVGLLAEAHKLTCVSWVRAALERASAERMAMGDMDPMHPPPAMQAQFPVHELPDGGGHDAVHCAPLRLLCRLVGLKSEARGSDATVWYVPTDCVPGALTRCARVIDQYLAEPFVLEGHALSDLVRMKRPTQGSRTSDHARKKARQESRASPLQADASESDNGSDGHERFVFSTNAEHSERDVPGLSDTYSASLTASSSPLADHAPEASTDRGVTDATRATGHLAPTPALVLQEGLYHKEAPISARPIRTGSPGLFFSDSDDN